MKTIRSSLCLITTMLFTFAFTSLFAQESESITVSGIVIDEHGNELPGATITVVNGSQTVAADMEGRFSIQVKKGQEIRISFVTMIPETVKIENNKTLKVVLKSYDISLGEVVITGYNQTTTRRITGSVAVVGKEELQGKPLQNIDQLLQGKVAGMSISAKSGRPGESAQVRIRGTNTITGNAEPLWVVDGVPLQKDIPTIASSMIKARDFSAVFSGGIAGINPNDIESVTILKDASATAIYGSRAAGGVIVVTTKRGKAGRMQVNYGSSASLTTKPQRSLNLMNSSEKIAWEQELWDEYAKKGYEEGSYYPVVGLVGMVRSGKGDFSGWSAQQQDNYLNEATSHTTNWFDELFQNSISQNHHLSFSGGNEFNKYYISSGYSNEVGLVKNTGFDRYNVSAKVDMTPNYRFQLGLNLDLSGTQSKGPSLTNDVFKYAYFANPYERPYHADGTYKADQTYFNLKEFNGGGFDNNTPPNGINILRELDQTTNLTDNYSGTATVNMSYKILDYLKFTGVGSYSYDNNQSENINGRYTHAAYKDRLYFDNSVSTRTYGSIMQSNSSNSSYMLRGQFVFDKAIGNKHLISALAGSELRRQMAKNIYSKRYGYDELTGNSSIPIPQKPIGSDWIDYNDIISYAAMVDGLAGQSIIEDAFASFYISSDYSYDRKYVLSLTARTDGSNNFGSEQQFNPTWSAGVSWNADQENFFESLKPIMSTLSLRLATGYTGNVNRQVYPQLIMDYLTTFRKTYDDYYRMGRIGNAPNRNLRWEKTKDYKIALDFGFLDNRITGTTEYYNRQSRDLVTRLRVPSTTGFTAQSFNTSSLENTGFELTLNSVNIQRKDFSWNSSINIAYNNNKLTKFTTPTGSVNTELGQQVGYPLSSIFSGKIIGIDPLTGIYTYELRPDAVIKTNQDLQSSDNYLYYLGTSTAPITGGFGTSARYKSWSLSVSGNYSLGGKIIDDIQPVTTYSSIANSGSGSREPIPTYYNDLHQNHVNVNKDRVNRWTTSNPMTDAYPRIIDHFGAPIGLGLTNPNSSSITRASLLQDVSYLRVGSLNIGYSINEKYLSKYKLSSLGFYFSMTNLFTFTNYNGIDPETPGAVYPLTRSMSFGVNIGL